MSSKLKKMKTQGMWHEARRQERRIRGLMVDYKRRAERRREYYEKIKLDPAHFLRIYSRQAKIHLDAQTAIQAEGPNSMMPWQGNPDIMIDRFDARASLDCIPEVTPGQTENANIDEEEERQCNYERYRVLVQNEAAGVSEEQCLQQIYIDEQFGAIDYGPSKKAEEDKKKLSDKKAAIGYKYEDDNDDGGDKDEETAAKDTDKSDESEDDDDILSDDEIDLDMALDIDQLTSEQMTLLNQNAVLYGMKDADYTDLLRNDKEESEQLKLAKLLEEERAQFSGRKSRRERRAYKEKRLQGKPISPPSYAARESPKYENYRESSSSRSRSRSPETEVHFITSFGGESDEEGGVVQGPALPPNMKHIAELRKLSRMSKSPSPEPKKSKPAAIPVIKAKSKSKSKSKSRSRTRSKSKSRSRSRSRSRRSVSRSRSRSRSYRKRSHTRSRSRSRSNRVQRSRSRSRRDSRSSSRKRSRSKSRRRRSRSRSRRRHRRSRSRSSSKSTSRSSSRSRSYSRSRSRSISRGRRSYSRSYSRSRSSSRSPASLASKTPPVKRYRRPSLSSNDSDGDDDKARKASPVKKSIPAVPYSKGKGAVLTLKEKQEKARMQEKLKKRMQAALNRQFKADRQARMEKEEKVEQERHDREEELRAMAIQLRRRERERRHRQQEDDFSDDSAELYTSKSKEEEKEKERKHSRERGSRSSSSRSRHRSRSRSRSRDRKPRLVDY